MAIERLSSGDRLMLAASERWPQEIGALMMLDGVGLWDAGGQLCLEAIRERIGGRLHLVPRLRQVILQPGRGLGGPLWVDAPQFDITDHVNLVQVDRPGGETELLGCAERLRRRRLDPTRPGWEMWFITGLPSRQVGLFVKIQHAMADGMAAMTIIGTLLDTEAAQSAGPAPAWRPSPPPRTGELVWDVVRGYARGAAGASKSVLHPRATLDRLRGAVPALRELLADEPPPQSSLGYPVGDDRRLAAMRCTLAELRSIARAHDATINDVFLVLVAGGLRALLKGRGESVEGMWAPIYVPISTRRRWRGAVTGNRVAQMAVPLPLETADASERLARIAAATAIGKRRDRSAAGKLLRSGITARLVLMAAERQRVHVCSANIPGPRDPIYLTGSRVCEVVPILPLIGRVGLGVGAVSYAGAFTIGLTADRDSFPDLDTLIGGMESELDALARAAG